MRQKHKNTIPLKKAQATPLFIFLLFLTILNAQADLSQQQDYQNGLQALQTHLPKQAAIRFQKALKDPKLNPDQLRAINIKLSEAYIRAEQWQKAEDILNLPGSQGHPDRFFWLGQAQQITNPAASLINLKKATQEQESPLSGLAHLSLAKTLVEQKKFTEAMMELQAAEQVKAIKNRAKLQQIELFLQQKKPKPALEILEKIKPKTPLEASSKRYLNARYLLETNQLNQAEAAFKQLLTEQKTSAQIHLGSRLGLASTYAKKGERKKSSQTLFQIIQQNKNAPKLHLYFLRLEEDLKEMQQTETLVNTLQTWITQAEALQINQQTNNSEKSTQSFRNSKLHAYSCYLLAKTWSLSSEKQDWQKAQDLLTKLDQHHQSHFFKNQATWLKAELHLKQEQSKKSLAALETLLNQVSTEQEKARVRFFISKIHLAEKNPTAAKEAIKEMTFFLDPNLAETAKINLALLHLQQNEELDFNEVLQKIEQKKYEQLLVFEHAKIQLLNNANPSQIQQFIANYPKHPKSNTARLLLLQHHLRANRIDNPSIAVLIKQLTANKNRTNQEKRQTLHLESRWFMLKKDWKSSIDLLNKHFTEQKKASKNKNTANHSEYLKHSEIQLLLSLGESYFHNKEYNKARKVLQQILKYKNNKQWREYAYFFSGMSALREGTPQSILEAGEILDKVISLKGNLYQEAVLQRVRLWNNASDYDKSIQLLEKTLTAKPKHPSLKLHLEILRADAYYRRAVTNKQPLDFYTSLNIYWQLLENEELELSWKNQIQFLIGQTQEKLKTSNLPTNPTNPMYSVEENQKITNSRTKNAMDSYFKIINLEFQKDKTAPAEWYWYYKAGLRATYLLEQEENWNAAIAVLTKIAHIDGPQSDVLLNRANKLSLAHQILEQEQVEGLKE